MSRFFRLRSELKILPLTIALVLSACSNAGSGSGGGIHVLSSYKSYTGVGGFTRPNPHSGIDYQGYRGDPVLAAGDGTVHRLFDNRGGGLGIGIFHPELGLYTGYNHLSEIKVKKGETVRRGQIIGSVGATGASSMGIPHLHFEVNRDGRAGRRAANKKTENPDEYIVGCFEEGKSYPATQLTYPVPC